MGILYIPDGPGLFPAVVVCHPHPSYGGSMDNNVVNTICESLASKSIISFKFNFRGVNGSQGVSGNGIGEQNDVLAAISFVCGLKIVNQAAIGLAGYSAGAAWGLSAGCMDQRVKALAAISPPITMFDFGFLRSSSLPKLMISGKDDDFIPVETFEAFCSNLNAPKECLSVSGTDHFWWGFESRVSDQVTGFFLKYLSEG